MATIFVVIRKGLDGVSLLPHYHTTVGPAREAMLMHATNEVLTQRDRDGDRFYADVHARSIDIVREADGQDAETVAMFEIRQMEQAP